jgi:hypothetical protein
VGFNEYAVEMSRAQHLSTVHEHDIATVFLLQYFNVCNRVPIFRSSNTMRVLKHFCTLPYAQFILCAAETCRSRQQRTEPVPWRSNIAVAELRNQQRTGTLSYKYFV